MQIYYFSRTGCSKKIAEELAIRYNTTANQIDDGKEWKGMLKYIKAGYMSSKKMELEVAFKQPNNEDQIVVVFPVWAGSLPPAIRSFMSKIKPNRIIAIPTSLISSLKERNMFYKVIDLVGKDISVPDQLS